ncbi:MAG: class I SAM-dependent methyltransferase [Candidatus Omnitrophica bacterium]|nr:class I SAM-dependent methyltransferase [Candidatus Omnitrophota bacterium]
MGYLDFISQLHTKTERNYLERMAKYDKAHCAQIAKKLDRDYWDGDRKYGYGGYHYDGRWKKVAEDMKKYYNLASGQKVLDIGCGKGFFLYDLKSLIPDIEIRGIDVSKYALDNSKQEIKNFLDLGSACNLPYPDNYFDLIVSINTLHYLYINDLKKALQEIVRVGKDNGYIVVESYRNEKEKANLLCWQLTCECFFTPSEWEWLFKEFGYRGDYSFVFFE